MANPRIKTGGLPFLVEGLDALAARYPAALLKEWDGDAMVANKNDPKRDRPGLHREHVFDLEWVRVPDDVEYWRAIVSVERHTEFGRVLHFSTSCVSDNQPVLGPFFFTRAMLIYATLSGTTGRFATRQQFMSEGNVVHLILDAPPEPATPMYPPDWPKCPGCGEPALDGHITCGNVACDEGGRR